jgi:hypothetical protein
MLVNPGWAGIIRICKIYVWCTIAARLTWWIILLLIRFDFVICIILCIDLAKIFGKRSGFGSVCLFWKFFLPILGFRSAQYQ